MAFTQIRCAHCGCKNVQGYRTYTIRDGEQRTIYHCSSCDSAFSETRNTPALVPFRVTQSFMPLFESRGSHGARSHGPESLKPLPGLDGSESARGRNYAQSSTHLSVLGGVLCSWHTYWCAGDRPHNVVAARYGRLPDDWHESLGWPETVRCRDALDTVLDTWAVWDCVYAFVTLCS